MKLVNEDFNNFEHQTAITTLTSYINAYLGTVKKDDLYFAVSQAQITNDQSSPVPNIQVRDKLRNKARIIIEVCAHSLLSTTILKVKTVYLNEPSYAIKQAFVFDYENSIIYSSSQTDVGYVGLTNSIDALI